MSLGNAGVHSGLVAVSEAGLNETNVNQGLGAGI